METHRRKIAGRAIALTLLAVTAPVFSVPAEAQRLDSEITVLRDLPMSRMQQQQRQQQRQQRQQQLRAERGLQPRALRR